MINLFALFPPLGHWTFQWSAWQWVGKGPGSPTGSPLGWAAYLHLNYHWNHLLQHALFSTSTLINSMGASGLRLRGSNHSDGMLLRVRWLIFFFLEAIVRNSPSHFFPQTEVCVSSRGNALSFNMDVKYWPNDSSSLLSDHVYLKTSLAPRAGFPIQLCIAWRWSLDGISFREDRNRPRALKEFKQLNYYEVLAESLVLLDQLRSV